MTNRYVRYSCTALLAVFGDFMRLLLQILSLSDRYERKACLLPGLLLAAVPALTAWAVLHEFTTWEVAASTSLGVEFLVAFVLGHLARARGRRMEEVLWKEWGGPPTTRWLRPWDNMCSDQQKSKWRAAIKRATGLTLPASIPDGGDRIGVDRVNTDAVRQLRYFLRGKSEAAMVAIHNEDYGFARNLCGVRWHWVVICLACFVVAATAFAFGLRPFVGLAIAGVCSITAFLIARELPVYVRRSADRYAESLFAACILADGNSQVGTSSRASPAQEMPISH